MVFRNEYWFLSNFYLCKIEVNGYVFLNAESAFQAMKCTNEHDVLELTKLDGASAKRYGRHVNLRKDWDTIRINAMRYVLTCKFQQNLDLLAKLKAINEPIVETNTWNDKFWGVCQGVGENHLGKLLDELKVTL